MKNKKTPEIIFAIKRLYLFYQIRNIKPRYQVLMFRFYSQSCKPAVLFEWTVDVRPTCNDRQCFSSNEKVTLY